MSLIAEWVDQHVHVTLNATMPTIVQGKLLGADESGILLELANGPSFIPVTAILHISLDRTK